LFTGHVKPADLFPAVGHHQARLQSAAAHGVKGMERLTLTVQGLTGHDPAAAERQPIEPLDVTIAHAVRQAQIAQVATGTGRFQRGWHRPGFIPLHRHETNGADCGLQSGYGHGFPLG
jgi:hypothetical protein